MAAIPHRPTEIDVQTYSPEGWDLSMDIEDEQHVDNSLPSTPIAETSGHEHSQTWRYTASTDEDSDGERRGPLLSKDKANTPLESERPYLDFYQGEETSDIKAEAESQARDMENEDEEKQCRICFSGPEEEVTLGRMISPCLCSGSMRQSSDAIFLESTKVKCLNAWRGTGTNAKAHLGRSSIFISTNVHAYINVMKLECPQCHYRYQLRRTLISGLATSRPILLLSTLFLFTSLSLLLGQILLSLLHYSPSISRALLSKSSSRTPMTSMFDLLDDPYGAFDDGPVIIVGGGGTLVWDIFITAIQTFVELSNSFLTYKDKISSSWLIPGSIANFGFELSIRFLLGLAMLGSMSFLSLLLSLSLFGPLQLLNGLRGFGFLGRRFRNTRNSGNLNSSSSTSIGTIMIIGLVLIGAINTLIQFYNLITIATQKLLLYVETQILEVNSEEIKKERRRKQKEKLKRDSEKWYIRWIKDGQYRSSEGWKEIIIRLSIYKDRKVENIKRWLRQEDNHEG
ncbi:uncharacterized protein L201_005914 [Kwoniella dendrophila CBS 6074]|uniref:RING-CH-type domain-containing protein n=1 Tax=Kwoniella dendrophila CBS 6074 TaxID=1295534 RepID=A0AAX4K2C2_9TREE